MQESFCARQYHGPDIFAEGTVHHAAEVGSVKALQQCEQQQRQLRGLPCCTLLEQRDELLQSVPLHVAAERGHLDVVKYIISHDVDLDAADGHQVRPLHLAAINNHCHVVKALVDKGANVTKQDSDGDLPTHWAATKGHEEVLEMLFDRGAPVDAHNKAGWTALHRAAYNGRVASCRLLLRRGASIHAVNHTGCTALHLAAANNHLGVMELLLQLGASLHMKDQQGAKPADLCISDAARSLLQEKDVGQSRQAEGSCGRATQPSSAHSTPGTGGKAAPAAANITRVPHMPRFKPAANTNLDADGFPTAEAQGALQAEASEAEDDDMAQSQLLLVEGAEQLDGDADLGDGMSMSLLSASLPGAFQAPPSIAGSMSFSSRQLSRPSSKQQYATTTTLSASGSFKGSSADTRQLQPLLSGKHKQSAGPMQRFLKQYSLDRKGLFAP